MLHFYCSSRFFPMFPARKFSLTHWLTMWLQRGAVPIATLNLQRGVPHGSSIPDAWHHQMIFGVCPQGVYLTNPLERVTEEVLMAQLSSPSTLLVRKSDVIWHYDVNDCDLSELTRKEDERWDHYNVLGQVVNILRQEFSRHPGLVGGPPGPDHIKIPASYRSGITLTINRSSPHFQELRDCPDLPLLSEEAGLEDEI